MKTFFSSISRRLYRTLASNETKLSLPLIPYLRFLCFLRDRAVPIQSITDFSADEVIVLAPHMDDEILGCGGTLRKHALSNAKVTVVYMTDGRKGNPEAMTVDQELALIGQRKKEAIKAAKIIGIQEQIFLDNPDGRLVVLPEVVRTLRDIMLERRPTIVYLPSLLDFHQDHWATNCLFYAAIKELSFPKGWTPICRGFEVWSPIFPNRLADVTDVIGTKELAIQQFESQILHTDFVRTLIGLNAYRSLYCSHGRGFAEAFYESTPEQYCLLFQCFSAL